MKLRGLVALCLLLGAAVGCGTPAPPPGTPPLPKQEEAPAKPPYSDTMPMGDPMAPMGK